MRITGIVRAIPHACTRRSHLRLCSWFSNVYQKILQARLSNRLSEPTGCISVALKGRDQGTSSLPRARSAEYFLRPVTVHSTVATSPSQKQRTYLRYLSRQMSYDSSSFTATAYQSEAFSGSLSHTNDSPTTASHTSLYTW